MQYVIMGCPPACALKRLINEIQSYRKKSELFDEQEGRKHEMKLMRLYWIIQKNHMKKWLSPCIHYNFIHNNVMGGQTFIISTLDNT